MKKYMICLCLFVAVSAVCLVAGYTLTAQSRREQVETETETAFATEAATQDQMVINNSQLTHQSEAAEEYYLVAEDGFLLVFLKDKKTICLYTHIPVMDFPSDERDKLRDGIWFSSMMEVFNYLESYTS